MTYSDFTKDLIGAVMATGGRMNDPAERAANRVALSIDINSRIYYHHMLDSAREALRPIRELIDEWESSGHLDYAQLRSLVYPTEEAS